MTNPDPRTRLGFAPPDEAAPRNYDEAERQCLSFADLFLRKSRELNEVQRAMTEILDDTERRYAFVVRNLLDAAEKCAFGAAHEAPAPEVAAEPTEAEPVPQAVGADRERHPAELALESVRRLLVYILEQLGVQRVELLGQTYASVVFDGRPIADPFEVMSSTQQGKASDRIVTQVIRDLWIDRDGRVVQKGCVVC